MSLQTAITSVLNLSLPAGRSAMQRSEKEILNDLSAGDALMSGLAIFVLPPMATSALQGVSFVFFDGMEIRVRIMEIPTMNEGGLSCYELMNEIVPAALHWQPSKAIDAELAIRLDGETDPEAVQDTLTAMQLDPGFSPYFELGGLLSHPISLARRPVEMIDGKADIPGFERNGELIRVADVIFNAVLSVPGT